MTPAECSAILRRGFGPADLQWKVQTCGKGNQGIWARIVPYVDARAVITRLDEAFGPLGYSITYEPVAVGQHAGMKCRIDAQVADDSIESDGTAGGRRRIYTVIREDVSEASDLEPLKGAASGALKRAFVQLGGGAYLYESPDFYAVVGPMTSQLPFRGRTKPEDGKETFKWGLPVEAFQWMETTSGIAATPTAAVTASGPRSEPSSASTPPNTSASPAPSRPAKSAASAAIMPGKPGMWKDKSQVSWAGKPIEQVPFAILKECLEYSTMKAEKPDNKYARFAAIDANVCLTEMHRREDQSITTNDQGDGPGKTTLADEEWPEENPFPDDA